MVKGFSAEGSCWLLYESIKKWLSEKHGARFITLQKSEPVIQFGPFAMECTGNGAFNSTRFTRIVSPVRFYMAGTEPLLGDRCEWALALTSL